MRMEALTKIDLISRSLHKKLIFWTLWIFNILMYLILFFIIFLILDDKLDSNNFYLVPRVFKASLDFIIGIGIIISGIRLVFTVKKLSQIVPKNLLVWVLFGFFCSIFRCFEQILFFVNEDNSDDGIFVLILFSYNFDDILPTLVFLQAFKVYSKFLLDDMQESDSFFDEISTIYMKV